MLAIEKRSKNYGKCTPNVLPCRINHNGAVNASKRYWNPIAMPDGKTVSYFRGRKLHARRLKVPEAYRGVVVSKTERVLPRKAPGPVAKPMEDDAVEEDEEDECSQEVRVMEEQAEFDEIMLWGHEALPDDTSDAYIRGVEEWIAFAGKIHSFKPEYKSEGGKADETK